MADAARRALKSSDFVLVWADEAAEAALRGDIPGTVAAIEAFDHEIAGPLIEEPGPEGACRILCETSAERAAAVTDAALPGLVDTPDVPAYEQWRQCIRRAFLPGEAAA